MSDETVDAGLPDGATTCAAIKDGVVVNMIIATPYYQPPEGYIVVCDPPPHVTIGTKYDGKNFEPPPPEITPLE